MNTASLIRRATTAVVVIELLCALAFSGAALWHERNVRLRALDQNLRGRSDSLIGAVQDAEDPNDNVMVDPEEFSPEKGDAYAVYNPNGRVVGTFGDDLSAVSLQNRNGFRNLRVRNHHYRVLERDALRIIDREETNGVGLRRPVKIVYAIRTDRMGHEVMEAARFYLLLSLAAVIGTAIVLVWLARRLLRPLNDLVTASASIGPSSLEFIPPPLALHTTELRPLAESLSLMIRRLREAFETERRFLSDAAHELKTAVAVVRSSTQILTMRERTILEYRDGLDRILADNSRVEGLVARMLTLARFDQNSPASGETSLADAIDCALADIASYAEERGVSLQRTVDPGITALLAPDAANILITNLVINAIQHSSRGFQVLITAQVSEAAKGTAILQVQDWGTGISAESLPHVFERFFREDPSRSRETGGAGLGLSICKSIVDNAGGTIEIESRKGIGTLVTISLKSLSIASPTFSCR